jgi:NADPH2:quinone reductase
MSAGSAAPAPSSISTSTPRAGSTTSAFRSRSIEEIREIFDEVRKDIWPAVESRKLQLPIDKVFAFDDIGKAFEHMEANRHLGKIVVTL